MSKNVPYVSHYFPPSAIFHPFLLSYSSLLSSCLFPRSVCVHLSYGNPEATGSESAVFLFHPDTTLLAVICLILLDRLQDALCWSIQTSYRVSEVLVNPGSVLCINVCLKAS